MYVRFRGPTSSIMHQARRPLMFRTDDAREVRP